MERLHIYVSGRVQGVGFRYYTQKMANKLGIKGWVRNCPDGRVELEAEAEQFELNKFKNRLEEGPSLSRVDELKISKIPLRNNKGFEIKY